MQHAWVYPYICAVAHECNFILHMSSCSWLMSVMCFLCAWVAAHAHARVPLCEQLLMTVMFFLHMSSCSCNEYPYVWAAAHEWMPKSFSRTNTPIPGWRRCHMTLWIWEGAGVEHLRIFEVRMGKIRYVPHIGWISSTCLQVGLLRILLIHRVSPCN